MTIYRFFFLFLFSVWGSLSAQNQLLIPDTLSGTTLNLTMDEGTTVFFPGTTTQTMGVNGDLLGPTLLLNQGDSVTLNVTNSLTSDSTTMHWHGMHVSPQNDGGPHNIILPNTTWSPSFKVRDRAGVYWYHPHLHMKTNTHVSKGVAGMIIVRDTEEGAMSLPRTYGVNDIPVILQTKAFDSNRQILVHSNSDSVVMVNGTVDAYHNVGAELIRLRLLNGSSQRSYNLGLSNNANFFVIGSDGGLLASPVSLNRLVIAPGERYEVVLDLSSNQGDTLSLMSYASEFPNGIYGATNPGMGQMMSLTGYNPNVLNGSNFKVLDFYVGAASNGAVTALPSTLAAHSPWQSAFADQSRTLTFTPQAMGMNQLNGAFLINGTSFSMNTINYSIPFGNIEIWTLTNSSAIAHPFHIHDVQFYLLDRGGAAPPLQEQGRKDVVLVRPMETVKFITRFETFHNDTLPYMYHCHLLTHEDDGMMGQFIVNSSTVGISESSLESSVQTYPNPSDGALSVISPIEIEQLSVYDVEGKSVYFCEPHQTNIELNLDLPSGVYFVEGRSSQGVWNKKWVVQ
jgi:bilirubin oxidase